MLSAHLLARKAGVPDLPPGWPCQGPLLSLAEDVVVRLLPAFNTNTGMPYGTVNLKHGVPEGETPVTCTAGVGTFIVGEILLHLVEELLLIISLIAQSSGLSVG